MQLITGATGHIGTVLMRTLLARGEKVRALVRTESLHASPPCTALAGLDCELVPGDILDPASILAAMAGVDVVYHLAARISTSSMPDPELECINVIGTRNMLAAARQMGVEKLVYASSIYALKPPLRGIIDESCPFDVGAGRGPYDRSKAAASLAVQEAAAHGMEAVIVSPTAVIGPYDYRLSEAGRGILYNLSPGIKFHVDGAYDFVDVRDVVDGILRAAQSGRTGQNYILGGERLTVQEVAQIIWETAGGWHAGVKLPDWLADLGAAILPHFSDTPLVTPYMLEAIRSNSNISHAKAASELGYRPRPARQALRAAVEWWLAQRQGVPMPENPEPLINATA